VTVPVGQGDFGQTARAAQKSFDANKHLAAVPFDRVLELATPEQIGVTPVQGATMMLSLLDFRGLADADANRLGIYLDNLSHGGINAWVIRHADQTTVTVSYPETSEGRHSVHDYIGVLREAFAATVSDGWSDEVADEAFAHSA